MEKNTKISCFLISMLTILCGCNKDQNPVEPEKPNVDEYADIYNGTSKKKANRVWDATEFNRASYGYKFNSSQGYNGWRFYSKEGTNLTELNGDEVKWTLGNDSLSDGVVSTDSGHSIVYAYKASEDGNYVFGGTFKCASEISTGGQVKVLKNSSVIYPNAQPIVIDGGDQTGLFFESSVTLKANDELMFEISGKDVYFNPSLAKRDSMYDSLYNSRTEWGYYGDLHAYYHNKKLYLYHLWNFTGNDEGWRWAMQTTQDMFRYVEGGFDDSFVTDHYMKYGSWPDLFFPQYISSRDRTVFKDKDVNKYRTIGLCYKDKTPGRVNCDLALRTSDDALGYEWTKPAIALREFPNNSGEPECSQLFKMGNRWYLTTGINGDSIHGVGGLSYWFGGENQTIDEIDWKNLPTNRLDGEDCCVPQVEKVANKYYMFGWMPSLYNGYRWGGYKNLAREVYQLPDGTLGSRIDPVATKLLNKGRFFNLSQRNVQISESTKAKFVNDEITFSEPTDVNIDGIANSSFTTFDAELTTATEVSISASFVGTNDRITATVYHENGKTYVRVFDQTGFQSAVLLVSNEMLKNLSIKLVTERSNMEICVNDLKVMSARTRVNSIDWKPSFRANGGAKIKNISFNRLAQYYDIYD